MFNVFKKKNDGEQLTLSIKGMHCTSCAMNIDGALEDLDGVQSAETSYAKACVNITYDATKVTETQLIQAISNEGYQASKT